MQWYIKKTHPSVFTVLLYKKNSPQRAAYILLYKKDSPQRIYCYIKKTHAGVRVCIFCLTLTVDMSGQPPDHKVGRNDD